MTADQIELLIHTALATFLLATGFGFYPFPRNDRFDVSSKTFRVSMAIAGLGWIVLIVVRVFGLAE